MSSWMLVRFVSAEPRWELPKIISSSSSLAREVQEGGPNLVVWQGGSPRSETDPWFNYLIVKILSLYFPLQAVTFPKESWCLVSEGPGLSQGTLLITCPSCTDCISLEGCLGFGSPQALWHRSPRAENWWFQVLSPKLTRMACPLD